MCRALAQVATLGGAGVGLGLRLVFAWEERGGFCRLRGGPAGLLCGYDNAAVL